MPCNAQTTHLPSKQRAKYASHLHYLRLLHVQLQNTERHNFRGQLAAQAVWLQSSLLPSAVMSSCFGGRPRNGTHMSCACSQSCCLPWRKDPRHVLWLHPCSLAQTSAKDQSCSCSKRKRYQKRGTEGSVEGAQPQKVELLTMLLQEQHSRTPDARHVFQKHPTPSISRLESSIH